MTIEDDAVEIVAWYEGLPNRETRKKDAQIAEELRWFVGGWTHSGHGGKPAAPDVGRVRRARRYVCTNQGLFEDYNFGTRRSGGGTNWSRLSRKGQYDSSTVADGVHQLVTGAQMQRRYSAETARIVDKLEHLARECVAGGDMTAAFALFAASNDYKADGKLRAETTTLLGDAGIDLAIMLQGAS